MIATATGLFGVVVVYLMLGLATGVAFQRQGIIATPDFHIVFGWPIVWVVAIFGTVIALAAKQSTD